MWGRLGIIFDHNITIFIGDIASLFRFLLRFSVVIVLVLWLFSGILLTLLGLDDSLLSLLFGWLEGAKHLAILLNLLEEVVAVFIVEGCHAWVNLTEQLLGGRHKVEVFIIKIVFLERLDDREIALETLKRVVLEW